VANPKDFRRLLYRKAPEKSKLYDSGFLRIEGLQVFQSLMHGKEFNLWLVADLFVAIKRYSVLLSAALRGLTTTGVIDQDISHQSGGETIKLRAILPLNFLLIHQPQVRLVNQRRWLQRVVRTLPPQIPYR
jgi:hypothetical protein